MRVLLRQEKTLKPMANFIIGDDPLCILTPMANQTEGQVKQWMWKCQDFSEGEMVEDFLAARFNKVEQGKEFYDAWVAAKEFNVKAKAGAKDEELVWVEAIEDIAEVREDDIDVNKAADADGQD